MVPCTFIVVVEFGCPKTRLFWKRTKAIGKIVHSEGKFRTILGKIRESKFISWNK